MKNPVSGIGPAASTTRPDRPDHPVIHTPLGAIRGVREHGVEVFRGVRYAEPPVGERRFRPPVPVQPWPGIQDAITFGPAPLQPFDLSVGLHAAQMSEDCLTLNIWKPATPGPHPVLVWVHGGGQTIGSTRRLEYDGSGFARQGIVCVSVGYRLGLFGFLELGGLLGEPYRGSGNNALKDIQLALTWIQSHINCFGADPSRVTLGGESAGAKNVAALMGADRSRRLFHRVVMLSGGAHTTHSAGEAEALARQVMTQAGCSDARQLLKAPADRLLATQEAAIQAYPAKFAFRPVIDGDFLKAPLNQQIQNGEVDPLPALIGTCRDESALFMDLNAPVSPLRPGELAHLGLARMAEMQDRYAEVFPELSAMEQRVRMLTAEEYWIPSTRIAEALAEKGAPVWVCRFDHSDRQGARPMHVSDLPYWWNRLPQTHTSHSDDDQKLARLMHATLGAFVHALSLSAMPTGLDWPLFESSRRSTLCWNADPRILTNPRQDERRLWTRFM